MQQFIFPFIASIVTLVALDLAWLGIIMKDFYRSSIGHLFAPTIGWGAAVAFYIIFTLGLFYFVVSPAVAKQSLYAALLAGALYGFFTYATYDLTNMATLLRWPLSLTIVDMLWGSFLGSVLGSIGYTVFQFFNK